MGDSVSVETVADGTARVAWSTADVATVRAAVERALRDHDRVEALIGVDDPAAQRTATWSGLRREGVRRSPRGDLVVLSRLGSDVAPEQPEGFRSLLNSSLPRKRAIAQVLLRDTDDRVLLCQLTYKRDWDLPGGVVEVGESPRLAAAREVSEELALDVEPGALLLTDWLPPWSGWDDAVCLVFDGGVVPTDVANRVVREEREIRSVALCAPAEVVDRAADFTARRIAAALRALTSGAAYTESGR